MQNQNQNVQATSKRKVEILVNVIPKVTGLFKCSQKLVCTSLRCTWGCLLRSFQIQAEWKRSRPWTRESWRIQSIIKSIGSSCECRAAFVFDQNWLNGKLVKMWVLLRTMALEVSLCAEEIPLWLPLWNITVRAKQTWPAEPFGQNKNLKKELDVNNRYVSGI